MKNKKGISLIVLIVTIIVVIILAGVVILTLNKNNPIEGAKEAKFKEDVRTFQDDLALIVSKEHIALQGNRDNKINATSYDEIKKVISSFTKDYENKFVIQNDKLVYVKSKLSKKEIKWVNDLQLSAIVVLVPDEWKITIASLTDEGVPVPKGFEYVEGTKDTGTVIQDEKGNQFVWVPASVDTYVKDLSFPQNADAPTGDDILPSGVEDETADVAKYGGFYIGRYEAGVPDNQTSIDGKSASTSNKVGVPVCKQGATVWTNIDYNNAKSSAEQMISNEYVQTGIITGRTWDTTCHFIEDVVTSLTDSKTYGNYKDSESPANVEGYGTRQVAGYSDKWMLKNIYDLAGNVREWTSEQQNTSNIFRRGGTYNDRGSNDPVSYRSYNDVTNKRGDVGFRPRLYIK